MPTRPTPNKARLFVYGTLRPPAAKPHPEAKRMAQLLQSQATHLGRATLRGQLFLIDWYPGVLPSRSNNDRVVGDVFEFDADGDLLARLDAYEEATTGADREGEYHRRKCRITLDNGDKTDAWVYVYNRKVRADARIVSGDFAKAGGRSAKKTSSGRERRRIGHNA